MKGNALPSLSERSPITKPFLQPEALAYYLSLSRLVVVAVVTRALRKLADKVTTMAVYIVRPISNDRAMRVKTDVFPKDITHGFVWIVYESSQKWLVITKNPSISVIMGWCGVLRRKGLLRYCGGYMSMKRERC